MLPPGWPEPLFRLTILLSSSPEPLCSRVAALCRANPPLDAAAARRALYPIVTELVRNAAQTKAAAVGCEPERLLQFAKPAALESTLEGENAIVQRLDRRWGGMSLVALEAKRDYWMVWPGPLRARLIVLKGPVEVGNNFERRLEFFLLCAGAELSCGAGSLVLHRPSLVGTLLEAAQAAGILSEELLAAAAGTSLKALTAAGALKLDTGRGLATLDAREIRLSSSETQALQVLLRRPGEVSERAEFKLSLKLDGERALERVIVGLRNKLGDGVISTVRGAGYVLELEKAARAVRAN